MPEASRLSRDNSPEKLQVYMLGSTTFLLPSGCARNKSFLPVEVAFVINSRLSRRGFVQILVFFAFIVLVGLGILALGYGLSLLEARTNGRSRRVRQMPDASQDPS